MELLIGSHVREHGNREGCGRLVDFELTPPLCRLRYITVSPNSESGAEASARPGESFDFTVSGGGRSASARDRRVA